jgi:hypothetical protein
VEQWLACWGHIPKVVGSNPTPATIFYGEVFIMEDYIIMLIMFLIAACFAYYNGARPFGG